MEIQLITDWRLLDNWSTQWDALASGNPFRSWNWLDSWWQAYGSGHQPFVLLAIDDGKLVGFAPWYQSRSATQGRVIRWLGSGEACTDYVGISANSEHQEAVAQRFADWLAQSSSFWDLLNLDTVDEQDALTHQFVEKLESCGHATDRRVGMNCWRIELPETWDELLQQMSKSHRKQLRRVDRRLLETGQAQLHTASNAAELEESMAVLVDLHQRRRQTLGQPGCFASASFDQFLHDVAARFLANESLRLHWVSLEGRPVAAEFQIAGGTTTYCYQAGIDPDAIDAEPGRLIMIATIRQAIESGQQSIDFLRGDEPYKAHWRAAVRPTVDVRVVSRKTMSRIRNQVWKIGDTLKHWLKASLSNTETANENV